VSQTTFLTIFSTGAPG